ncbi:MAG: helix-turn-helix domain-containing protein [Ottowia sp.]|uniref:helix-turn-helix domain-containing protein n=1 Tax=Ottowia sp. TaxID=1898956 RepID=UPI003C70AEA6
MVAANKQKAPGVQPEGFDKRTNKSRKFNSKSSTTEDQFERILQALRLRPHTTEDFRKLGIFQISARIFGLRARGYNIVTNPVSITDRDGYTHHGVALYSLEGEPVEEMQ